MYKFLLSLMAIGVCASDAHAEPGFGDYLARIGEAFESTRVPVSGGYLAAGAGWQTVNHLSVQGDVGYAWGEHNTGFLASTDLWTLGVAPRLTTGDQREFNLALLGGLAFSGFFTGGLVGGIDLRLNEELALGPIAKLRLGPEGDNVFTNTGTQSACLFVQTGVLLSHDKRDYHLSIGVELFHLPGPAQ